MSKTKKISSGMVFIWFVVAVTAVGVAVAVFGAVRDAVEDWNEK